MHPVIAENQTLLLATADATLEIYNQVVHASIPAADSITLTLPPVAPSKGINILVHVIADGGGKSVIIQDADDAYAPSDFKTALFNNGDSILLHCDGERWDRFGHSEHDPITVKIPLEVVDSAAGVFSWPNPESVRIAVESLQIDLTTDATDAIAALDAGIVATEILGDNLIDGLLINSTAPGAASLLTYIDDAGANGLGRGLCAVGSFVTGSISAGASAGLAGHAIITYRRL